MIARSVKESFIFLFYYVQYKKMFRNILNFLRIEIRLTSNLNAIFSYENAYFKFKEKKKTMKLHFY